jgi:hypothetical protein
LVHGDLVAIDFRRDLSGNFFIVGFAAAADSRERENNQDKTRVFHICQVLENPAIVSDAGTGTKL